MQQFNLLGHTSDASRSLQTHTTGFGVFDSSNFDTQDGSSGQTTVSENMNNNNISLPGIGDLDTGPRPHPRPRPRPAWNGASTTPAISSNRDNPTTPYNFPSSTFNFQYPPPSGIGSSRAPSAAQQIPNINARSPSPSWSSDLGLPDATITNPKGKKRQIEEVENEPTKSKPRKKTAAAPAAKSGDKKPRKVAVKREVKKEVKSGAKRGRKPGASGYSQIELNKLLRLINKGLPIGGAGWDLIVEQYNQWAKKNGYTCDRARKALRTKFDAIVRTPKPTGVGEVPEHIQLAWDIEEKIQMKAGTVAIDDSELDEGVSSANEDIIEISDDASSSDETTKTTSAPKTVSVAKAYRSTNPIAQPASKRSRPATEALSSITSIFNADSMKQRDDDRFNQNMQLTHFANMQIELRETRARLDQLRDQLTAETRRADRAEAQLDILKTMSGGSSFERYRNDGPRYHDLRGTTDDYFSNLHQHHSPFERTPARWHKSSSVAETERIAETRPHRSNAGPFDSPAHPMSLVTQFEVGSSSSPSMPASISSVRPSQFTVTISPHKSLPTENPSDEPLRLTEVTSEETPLTPSWQPTP